MSPGLPPMGSEAALDIIDASCSGHQAPGTGSLCRRRPAAKYGAVAADIAPLRSATRLNRN